jgi:pimeloyl-ACP methyl ester carboxylesterase
MKRIKDRLPKLVDTPVQLLWAPDDPVFTIAYRDRIKELIPHAEVGKVFPGAQHFLQDDCGPEIVPELIAFFDRVLEASR